MIYDEGHDSPYKYQDHQVTKMGITITQISTITTATIIIVILQLRQYISRSIVAELV